MESRSYGKKSEYANVAQTALALLGAVFCIDYVMQEEFNYIVLYGQSLMYI
jgi:hypothetical protein